MWWFVLGANLGSPHKAEEYPSVRVYAQKMKNTLMAAHDALLTV